MPIAKQELEYLIRQAFPKATIEVKDLTGQSDHYAVTVLDLEFVGKTMVQQHQMVYQALGGIMGTDLHAMALKTGPLLS